MKDKMIIIKGTLVTTIDVSDYRTTVQCLNDKGYVRTAYSASVDIFNHAETAEFYADTTISFNYRNMWDRITTPRPLLLRYQVS